MLSEQQIATAQNDVNETYDYLAGVVQEVTKDIVAPLDNIVKELSKGINLFSNADLWDFQLRLGVETYILGNLKEQSSLKQACAEALYKEGLARAYSNTAGAVEAKKQQSVLDVLDKQVVSILWTTVSNLLKTKCDEAHRLVNIIQGIQISRAAEAKQQGPRSEVDRMNLTTENMEG